MQRATGKNIVIQIAAQVELAFQAQYTTGQRLPEQPLG